MKVKTISAAIAVAALAVGALAQNLNAVGAAKDWTVFQDPSNPRHCYVVTKPQSSKAFKDGVDVTSDVKRSDIRLYVGVKSGATEPSFLAGYPLDPEKAVEAKIGDKTFNFFTNPSANPEFAWPQSNNDAALIAAMKGGVTLEVRGLSKRGTQTVDTFSLSGFTASYNKAVQVCG